MQKSIYADPNVQDRGFTKHIHHTLVDMGVYPNDPSARLVELYKVVLRENPFSTGTGGGKPRNIELYRKALGPNQNPETGIWIRIADWEETKDYEDSSASGSVSVDPLNGDVHVMLVFGKVVNGVLRFQTWEETVKRATFAPPVVRPATTAGNDPRVTSIINQLGVLGQSIAQIETALGNIQTGGTALDPEDRSALDWLVSLRALLKT